MISEQEKEKSTLNISAYLARIQVKTSMFFKFLKGVQLHAEVEKRKNKRHRNVGLYNVPFKDEATYERIDVQPNIGQGIKLCAQFCLHIEDPRNQYIQNIRNQIDAEENGKQILFAHESKSSNKRKGDEPIKLSRSGMVYNSRL